MPTATPVKVTAHVPEDRVQLAPTVPTPVFDETKLTLPDGTLAGFLVSPTVAVQVEALVGIIELGLQATLVDVLSLPVTVTVMVAAVLVLIL
jgi:hypothetical protein